MSHLQTELPLQWEIMSALLLWLIQASCGVSPVLFIAMNVLSLWCCFLATVAWPINTFVP